MSEKYRCRVCHEPVKIIMRQWRHYSENHVTNQDLNHVAEPFLESRPAKVDQSLPRFNPERFVTTDGKDV